MKPFTLAAVLFVALALVASAAADPVDAGAGAPGAATAVAPTSPTPSTSQPAATGATPSAEDVGTLVVLFKEHKWRPAIALLITIIVFVVRKFLSKIPSNALPWVAAGLGILSALPAHLAQDPFVWWKFLLDGFIVGSEAIALWSLVAKKVLGKYLPDKG